MADEKEEEYQCEHYYRCPVRATVGVLRMKFNEEGRKTPEGVALTQGIEEIEKRFCKTELLEECPARRHLGEYSKLKRELKNAIKAWKRGDEAPK